MNIDFILKFLRDLARHNDREWFEKNRSRYLEAKQEFESVVETVLKEIVKFDPKLEGLDAKKLPFRIYRDVRFSKDKRPYKIHMGAGFSPNGKLVQEPGYYLHLQPGNKSFVAGGIYEPDAANLSKIRQEIDYNADGLKQILNARPFRKLFDGFDDYDRLKTAPKGYPKDHPHIEWLKHKSFIVSVALTDKQVADRSFVRIVSNACRNIKPLNDYIRDAIS
jgi:uncharacterized protein (TIGR02453 family)